MATVQIFYVISDKLKAYKICIVIRSSLEETNNDNSL
jgi:hypothetical protein